MTTGLKKFGGRFEPKKSALEKDSTLPVYVAFKQSKNKTIAKTLLHADFIQFAPDYADDYFAPKVFWIFLAQQLLPSLNPLRRISTATR